MSADLRPEDFEILQDGKPQKITNFSYIFNDSAKPSPPPSAKSAKGIDPIPVAPAILTKEQVKRTVAIIIDDMTRGKLSADNVPYVRKALRKFVDEQMQPGSGRDNSHTWQVAGSLQQFTSNKQQLYTAIDRIYEGPTAATADAAGDCGGPSQGAPCDFSEEYFAAGTLGILDYVIGGMSEFTRTQIAFAGFRRIFKSIMPIRQPGIGLIDW